MNRLTASWVPGCLLLIPLAGAAVAASPAADANGPARDSPSATLEAIVVTGSYIRRTDTESPSPVTVLNSEEMVKEGFNSLADAIRSVTADSSGTLTQAFSGAMAGGASGVSLRGLSVDATLVLVDGHRMAPYPLADDGQRPFTDISSLPMGIVDRVEVLQDGASAIYGSDAIAGVVNVITKKQFTGLDLSAGAGSTYRWDGQSQRFAATFGAGDLAADGHNFYFNVEFRHQESISQEARGSYIRALDLTPWGGPDLRGGVVTGNLPLAGTTYTVPGQVAPLIGGQAADAFYQLPGCAAKDVIPNGGGCAWDTNQYKKLQPRTEGLNLSAHWTQTLAGDWSNAVSANYFLSQSEQYRQPNAYNVGIPLVPFVWAGAKSGIVNQFDTTTTQIVLPANSLDNPFNPASPYASGAQAFYGPAFSGYVGQPALFYGALTDIPPQHSLYSTDVYRLVDDLAGTVGAWDVGAAAGYVRDETHVTYQGFVNVSALNAAFASGTFRVGQNAYLNSPALLASLAPETHDVAISDIAFISATAGRKLLPLPGGDLAVATGVEARVWRENNPGQPGAPQGNILMDGSFYASGSQTVQAAFAEFSAPLLHSLELDAAGRVDHYQAAGTAFTPKFGVKWKILPQLALRATYARGFRAPGIAESGNAGTATSVAPAPVDPVRCPVTGAAADCSGQGSAVAILTRSNPNLQPEKSRSFTLGVIIEPIKQFNLTVDYFNIRRTNEITTAPYSEDNAVRTPTPAGSSLPGQIVAYVVPYVNASYSLVSGVDSELKTGLDLASYGKLSLRLDLTHLIQSQQTVDGTTYHWVGTVGPTALSGSVGTPASRGSATLDWTVGPMSTGVTFNYRSQMRGIDESLGGTCLQLSATNPHCYVAGFGYATVYGHYQWNTHLDVTATITNVTNRLPPLDTVTYGGQNYDASLDQAGAIGRYMEAAFHYRF
ncbi:MAG TPA: TonB-dependent receptor [Steroidobacteraceae bacterium]|jgi:iron complex outermembrane receptor protein